MKKLLIGMSLLLFSAFSFAEIGPRPVAFTPVVNGTIFVSSNGSGTTCTVSAPCGLQTGIEKSEPGDVVFLRGGIYSIGTIIFSKAGTSGDPIIYESYPGEQAILDGSNYKPPQWKEVRLSGNFVHLRKLEIKNIVSHGLLVTGSDNIVEGSTFHHNLLSGIKVWAADGSNDTKASRNIFRDNIFHNNSGAAYSQRPYNGGGNSNGITISYGFDNRVEYCLAYLNSDDGIDAWRSQRTYFGYNISHSNGLGTTGEGHGFKLGGPPPGSGTIAEHNLSYSNVRTGFTVNTGKNVTIRYNTTWNNAVSMKLDTNPIVDSNITAESTRHFAGIETNNSWQRAGTVQFISTDPNSPDFLKPIEGGGFEDIGAYAGVTTPT